MSALHLTASENKITFIKASDYKKSLWKNGQGKTSEIAIHPAGATLEKEDFLWRFSSAEISGDSNFSIFRNCDRLLTILSGKGIVMNDQPLTPLNIIQFSGDEKISCQLVQDQVIDLGLIYKRDHVSAKMTVKTFSANADSHFLNLGEGTHLLFCVNGSFSVGDHVLNANDTLCVEGSYESAVKLHKPATYVHIKICEIKNKPTFCKLTNHG
ncbi:MAG: HutD family protein [Bdellovibrio sp.]|nr:HutD family protein [Bdellovibrio sp.]